MYNLQDINDHFKLPIMYLDDKYKLDEHIIDDLELNQFKDNSNNSIYHYVFNPNDNFSKTTNLMWSKYYTTNKDFLNQSKLFFKNYTPINNPNDISHNNYIENIWREIKNDNSFLYNYQYIDWDKLMFLNNNSSFLFFLSIYSISSPVLSLITPIIFLIIPFLLLRIQNIPITFSKYGEIVQQLLNKHSLGSLFKFNDANFEQQIYIIITLGFYFYQMYQNVIMCIRYFYNMKKIHEYFYSIKLFLERNMKNIDNILLYTNNLYTYNYFNNNLLTYKNNIKELYNKLDNIGNFNFTEFKFFNIGQIMKLFYQLYDDHTINNTMLFCFGLDGYVNNINQLKHKLNNKQINFCFITSKKFNFKDAYYPPLLNSKLNVKNTYNFKKNYIITGPNAAGKTTFIKTTIINLIFSQQLCLGFYKHANITPYNYIHSYINIPDTSGRDSLFQAEARRCKNILDKIDSNKNYTHFCIFDELYSGTNPYEATSSAFSYLDYLSTKKNVKFILTTHYIDLCKDLDKNPKIKNYHMLTDKQDNKILYKYLLSNGISNIKGGIQVLYDLEYPKKIIMSAEDHLNK